jgi:hypothetical protein
MARTLYEHQEDTGYLSGPMMAHSLPVEVGEVGCAHDRTDDRIVHGPGTGMHNRQHNGLKKKYKRTNSNLQNIHIKLMIE